MQCNPEHTPVILPRATSFLEMTNEDFQWTVSSQEQRNFLWSVWYQYLEQKFVRGAQLIFIDQQNAAPESYCPLALQPLRLTLVSSSMTTSVMGVFHTHTTSGCESHFCTLLLCACYPHADRDELSEPCETEIFLSVREYVGGGVQLLQSLLEEENPKHPGCDYFSLGF